MNSKLVDDTIEALWSSPYLLVFTNEELAEDHIYSIEELNNLLKYIRVANNFHFIINGIEADYAKCEMKVYFKY